MVCVALSEPEGARRPAAASPMIAAASPADDVAGKSELVHETAFTFYAVLEF